MHPDAPSAAYPSPGQALSVEREVRVFWGLRLRLVRATIRRMLATARLRVTIVTLLGLLFWGSLFFLFFSGFDLLAGLQEQVVESLYNAFFFTLMAMLLCSSAIFLYTGR